MTQEYFDNMKADLLDVYKDQLCEESISAIQSAQTIGEFIGLLSKFSAFLNYKSIPRIDWVRKWFNEREYIRIAKENGVYFEGVHTISNPNRPIVVMGNANVLITCATAHSYVITLQDDCKCELATFCACSVSVRQKDNSHFVVSHKHNLTKVKVRKV